VILMIDNYDSFTYNLVQYLGQLGREVTVARNDKIGCAEIEELWPEAIVISPGPCSPDEAGISLAVIERFAGVIPILGVCLGHQAIGRAFGGSVVRAARLMHGKTSPILHDGRSIFRDISSPFTATRYHSLIVDPDSLPDCLEVTAWTLEGEIMGLRHRLYPLEGVRFHPESVRTQHGHRLLQNFLEMQIKQISHDLQV
jgi:anthranilate synthase/aminodeoxychorismate synthase-like glutamine amidotransferase